MSKLTRTERYFSNKKAHDLQTMSLGLYADATKLRASGYDDWADKLGDVAWELGHEAENIQFNLNREAS